MSYPYADEQAKKARLAALKALKASEGLLLTASSDHAFRYNPEASKAMAEAHAAVKLALERARRS